MTDHGIARDQLRAFIERIERLEEEKAAIAADIKEIYAEAKGSGFSTAIMREVVRLRKKDANERAEQEALLDLYLHALGMAPKPDGDDDGPRGSRPQYNEQRAMAEAAPRESISGRVEVTTPNASNSGADSVKSSDLRTTPETEPQVAPQPASARKPEGNSPAQINDGEKDRDIPVGGPVPHSPETADETVEEHTGPLDTVSAGHAHDNGPVGASIDRNVGGGHEVTSGTTHDIDGAGASAPANSTVVQFSQEETREERCLRLKPHCQRPSGCGSTVYNKHCFTCQRAIDAQSGGDAA